MCPIQVYVCPDHGAQEVFFRSFDFPSEKPCHIDGCGNTASHVISAPAVVDVKRGWDELANEYQRNPYTQSKAQLTNIHKRDLEMGKQPVPITEEAIQIGAKAIDEQNKKPAKDIGRQHVDHTRKRLKRRSQ